MMTLRPFNINDAETILGWCKDKHAFRFWSADRYKDFPAKPEEMLEQYKGDNMYPLTAVVGDAIIGHILLRYPMVDRTHIRFGFVIVDDSKRGKGYGKQMLRLAIEYAQRELGANRKGQWAFDLNQPYRLIVTPKTHPIPIDANGCYVWKEITNAVIVEIVNYHHEGN